MEVFKHPRAKAVSFIVLVSKAGKIRHEMIVQTDLHSDGLVLDASDNLVTAVSKYVSEHPSVERAKIVLTEAVESAAVVLGRRGGKARAKVLSSKRRKKIALEAVEKRWLEKKWSD